jgi:putative MFS transporter
MREPVENNEGLAGAEVSESERPDRSTTDAESLLLRMEQVPFSSWHRNARLVMGSATFFDAFNALSLAFALPTLIRLWHISPKQSGLLISAS